MGKDQVGATWLLHARTFIATGDSKSLAKAIDLCKDAGILEFLTAPDLARGQAISPREFDPIVESLLKNGRKAEAAAVYLLGIRPVALLVATPEGHQPKTIQTAVELCRQAQALSKDQGFVECEATFAGTLGTFAAKTHNFTLAGHLIATALEAYEQLAEKEEIYRWNVAVARSTLANISWEQKRYDVAERLNEAAVTMIRELGASSPIHQILLGATLDNLGLVRRQQHRYDEARRLYAEALSLFRTAEQQGIPQLPQTGKTLNHMGQALADARRFEEARLVLIEAENIQRRLVALTESFQSDLAATLNNLGNVLHNMHHFGEAATDYSEAAHLYRALADKQSEIFLPPLATTLNNLGIVLSSTSEFEEAHTAMRDALRIRRHLARTAPEVFRSELAQTLRNIAKTHLRERRFDEARAELKEAIEVSSTTDSGKVNALNTLGDVEEAAGNMEEAHALSQEAVAIAEASIASAGELWLTKGVVRSSYRRLLGRFVAHGDADSVFRCLAALHEDAVLVTEPRSSHGLDKAREALTRLATRVGSDTRILVAQTLPHDGLLLGLLRQEAPGLQYEVCGGFASKARELFTLLSSLFRDTGVTTPRDQALADEKRNRSIEALARELWEQLPRFIRETLHPDADHRVLVSCDPSWTEFPWEALRFGTGPNDYLGGHRSLARWSPLTASCIDELRPRVFGDGSTAAAVVAPWDTNPLQLLDSARREAVNVGKTLRSLGYELRPNNSVLSGKAATGQVLNALVREPLAILHYSGHGGINGAEEVLVLWDDLASNSKFSWSRVQFRQGGATDGATQCLPNSPLVVLNCCMAGRSREFGGKREDIAAAFLHEGAAAVIASPLPVSDEVGEALGRAWYDPASVTERVGARLVEVRRHLMQTVCAANPTLWPSWMLIACHGNPFASMPLRGTASPSAS